jgi:hypothetical protein
MKSVGIRDAKARLSELARAAAKGEATMLTDYGNRYDFPHRASDQGRERF